MSYLIIYASEDDRGQQCYYPVPDDSEIIVDDQLPKEFEHPDAAFRYIEKNAEKLGANDYWVISSHYQVKVEKETITKFKVYV